ncbi:hypothetical protein [Microbulbifer thermotolerans]|uniref:hypothetical protein n=1 Tax=Microbulbifer thermotolerans TaxID=252514 RepID=UPI00224B5D6D|nr:hypothetical protein [Microbulbifer thermotolerans]MCX2836364.1 hypothetical protein [Microbulbifer thermotolerans]
MLNIINKLLEWKYLSHSLYAFILSQIVVSYFARDNSWFSASGAVVGIFGLLLTVKNSLLKQTVDLELGIHQSDTMGTFPETFETEHSYRKRKRAELVIQSELEGKGVWLSVIGAVVWAYGFNLPVASAL